MRALRRLGMIAGALLLAVASCTVVPSCPGNTAIVVNNTDADFLLAEMWFAGVVLWTGVIRAREVTVVNFHVPGPSRVVVVGWFGIEPVVRGAGSFASWDQTTYLSFLAGEDGAYYVPRHSRVDWGQFEDMTLGEFSRWACADLDLMYWLGFPYSRSVTVLDYMPP